MMNRRIYYFLLILCLFCLFGGTVPATASNIDPESASAAEQMSEQVLEPPEAEDSIVPLEPNTPVDSEGNVTITMSVSEDVVLPVTITMKGNGKKMSFTITRNGQTLKLMPGLYGLKKVVDGTGKKLPSDARLTIPEEGGYVHFDFNRPNTGPGFTWLDIVKANAAFFFLAVLLYKVYKYHLKTNNIKN